MDKFMEFGITLTFILVCVSSLNAIMGGLGITDADKYDIVGQYDYDEIQAGVNAQQGPQSSYATFSPPSTLTDYLFWIPNLMIAVGTLLWTMTFGWTNLLYSILQPIGLELVFWPIIAIFGFIQLFTFLNIIRLIISAIRGATP